MATTVGPISVPLGLPGGVKAVLNVTAATVIKATPGICIRVSVVAVGSTSGTANDVATTGVAAAANQFGTLPNTLGTYEFDWPCGTGIVLIPGTSQVLAVSFT